MAYDELQGFVSPGGGGGQFKMGLDKFMGVRYINGYYRE